MMTPERLAEREESDVAEVVNRACRELLEKEGLWPPNNSTGQVPS